MARKFHQGKYNPINPDKYVGDVSNIIYRSSWEKKLMLEFDKNPNVLKWGSEVVVIKYFSTIDNKVRRYFTDFVVKYKDKLGEIKTDLIEVKPFKETQPPKKSGGKNAKQRYINECLTYQKNQDKWKFAEEYAKQHNMTFRIMTEYELGIKKK
jgi:hypothetical protein